MKNVTLAKSAGFCFGVKRAVNMVYEEVDKVTASGADTPIYTYGPIIHNDEVVKDFASKGVVLVKDISELASLEKGRIIVRSHGISRTEYEDIKSYGFEIVDATCPFVRKIHKLVDEHSRLGEYIIVIGNSKHPEVCGIRGWANGTAVSIIENKEEALNFSENEGKTICIVSQTTFNYNKFQELVEIIREKGYNILVLNTICNATEERQTEARKIAKEVEAMIVIGDKHSSNTQKLFEICNTECEKTYYVQTSKDMDYSLLKSINNVGITAGASTPNNIIEEVSKNVRNEL